MPDIDELMGTRLVCALAQVPHATANTLIASVDPLMWLETGEAFRPSPSLFPDQGYLFCYIPTGTDLQPGDLLVGTLKQAAHHGNPNSNWYELRVESGATGQSEVYEVVPVALRSDDSYRTLIDGRRPFTNLACPRGHFYVLARSELIGPFHAEPYWSEGGGSAFGYMPVRHADGAVRVYSGPKIAELIADDRIHCEACISSSSTPPQRFGVGTTRKPYRLIRKRDLAADGLPYKTIHLLRDELVVSRVCDQIGDHNRAQTKESKSLLNGFLAELSRREQMGEDVGDGLVDGLADVVKRISRDDELTCRLVQTVLEHNELREQIDAAVADQVRKDIEACCESIRHETEIRCGDLLDRLNGLRSEAGTVQAACDGLAEQRDELLAEIERKRTLLSALSEETEPSKATGSNSVSRPAVLPSGSNGTVTSGQFLSALEIDIDPEKLDALLAGIRTGNGRSSRERPDGHECEQLILTGPPLGVVDFINQRLLPTLHEHGCRGRRNHCELMHPLLVAAPLVAIPHPGWAAAYASAMGGSAVLHPLAVEPDWLAFRDVCDRGLTSIWRAAVEDGSRLHLIILDGIDRCPSHAWLAPIIHLAAGWANRLPQPVGLGWPKNLRITLTRDSGDLSFAVPQDLFQWIIPFNPEDAAPELEPTQVVEGHLPLAEWLAPASENDPDFDGLLKECELPCTGPATISRRKIGRVLSKLFSHMGRGEIAPRAIRWLLTPRSPQEETAQ